jgi:hypothetical protein
MPAPAATLEQPAITDTIPANASFLEETGAYVPDIERTLPAHADGGSITEETRPYPGPNSVETGRPEDIMPGVSPLEASQAAQKAFAEAHGLHRDDSRPSPAVLGVEDKLRTMSGHYMDRIAGGLSMYASGQHEFAAPEVRPAPAFDVSEQELVYKALQAQLPASGESRLPKAEDDRIEAAAILTWRHAAEDQQ